MAEFQDWRDHWQGLVCETYEERLRQERKFPGQVLPAAASVAGRADRPIVEALTLGIPTADIARDRCDKAHADGRLSWAHVITEEVCEYVEAVAQRDAYAAREEAIQCKAVFDCIIHAIDNGLTMAEGIELRGETFKIRPVILDGEWCGEVLVGGQWVVQVSGCESADDALKKTSEALTDLSRLI